MTRQETLDAIAAEIDSAPEEGRPALWKAVRQAAENIAAGRYPVPYRPEGEE